VDRAFWWIGGACILLFLGVTLAMVLFVFKYHRSRTTTTSQIEGNKWLEITWIVIPTLIVIWMFFVGYEGFGLMRQVPDGAMVVEVTGQKWYWTFRYPEHGIESKEMYVPVGQAVKCVLRAPPEDVIHSFYLPEFRVKEDVLPSKDNYLWFRPERIADYNIFCTEYCGAGHSSMITKLHVVSEEDFRQWVRSVEAKRYRPMVFEAVTDPNHESFGEEELDIDAKDLYGIYCGACHGAAGDGSGQEGSRDFRTAEGWKRSPKVVDIYRTLTEGLEGTQMRAFPTLTPYQKVAVSHYVRAFLEETPPADTREDYDELVAEYELDKIQPPGETIPVEQAMKILADEAADGGKQPATQPADKVE
jgi:cytochrome c oxidase subunit 2